MTTLKNYQLTNDFVVDKNNDLIIYSNFNQQVDNLNIEILDDAVLKILFVNSKLNVNFKLNNNSVLEIYNVFITNEKSSTNDININVDLNGINANTSISNLYLASNDAIINSNVHINHNKELTNSNFNIYAISKDDAKLVLNNNAHILNGMHQSNAFQKTKGLNLSPNAKIITQPNLFIDEYDVKASHSVAVGSINQDDLFYLMSRGLKKEDSEKLIVMGFINPVITNIDDETIKEDIYKQFIINL